jgi:ferrous iron transport protein B
VTEVPGGKKIVLVGNPNVGKSVIFRMLTGSYVLVSNFPGTTVEVTRGKLELAGITYEVVDTPGVYSLVPQSEDERVTCEILLNEEPDVIIQVADAKNLRRTLLVATQLSEFRRPMVLVLNMMDEAQERGIEIDTEGIAELLSVPLVETVAIYSQGKRQLLLAIQNAKEPKRPMESSPVEGRAAEAKAGCGGLPLNLAMEWLALDDRQLIRRLESLYGAEVLDQLGREAAGGPRAEARRIAARRGKFLDRSVEAFKKKRVARFLEESSSLSSRVWLAALLAGLVLFLWNELGSLLNFWHPYGFLMESLNRRVAEMGGGSSLLRDVLFSPTAKGEMGFGLVPALVHFLLFIAPVVGPLAFLIRRSGIFTYELGILTRRASTGIPILVCLLILVYEFVGFTGAQTLVGLIEDVFFGRWINPMLSGVLPSGFFHDLLAGEYGLVTMGLTYAIAIVFPVVGTFFIAFSLLEDSGYLPRLAILSDRVMRAMGLNGKAVLPIVLGFGCCTMATITTRILSSPKERLIATLLLALGIPCSAQLGVILGISASFNAAATLTVLVVVASQVLLVGYFSSRLIGGKRSEFIFEIPPIRTPHMKNVLLKTRYRMQWYLKEAVPLFLYGTLALFTLDKIAVGGRTLLVWLQVAAGPVLSGLLHVPAETATVFVLGFLRRDYGAAGLFDMVRDGMLTAPQAIVCLIVLTLFVPCLASFLVIIKEQGLKRALAISGFILPYAILVGTAVGWILRTLDITYR